MLLCRCTINPAYKGPELEYVLAKARVKALFLPGKGSPQETVNKFIDILGSVDMKNLPLKDVILTDGSPISLGALRVNDMAKMLKEGNSKFDSTSNDRLTADDPAIIMFTSGTTGKPKGAVLSHYNLLNNAAFTAARLGTATGDRTACIPVPLFHIFGMVYGSIMMTKVGLPIVLTGYRYNTQTVVEALEKYKCSHIMMVPAMTVDIMNYLDKNGKQLPSLHSKFGVSKNIL